MFGWDFFKTLNCRIYGNSESKALHIFHCSRACPQSEKKEMSSGADDDGDGERQEPVVYIMVRLYVSGKWLKDIERYTYGTWCKGNSTIFLGLSMLKGCRQTQIL